MYDTSWVDRKKANTTQAVLLCPNHPVQQNSEQWVAKYNISSRSVLRHWILSYNAHMELKDYYPQQEAYMAQARRKTTLEQRQEIVTYCLQKGLS